MVGWWLDEVDFREQTPDVAFGEQPTDDRQALGFRVAIAAASLGCDETVVVVDAEDGAGAHVDSGVGGLVRWDWDCWWMEVLRFWESLAPCL